MISLKVTTGFIKISFFMELLFYLTFTVKPAMSCLLGSHQKVIVGSMNVHRAIRQFPRVMLFQLLQSSRVY